MDILTIDFETYYAKDFGLKKYTTEEYIRDKQFEVIGVAVKKNNEETKFITGPKSKIKKFLDNYDWSTSVAVAHNARFDAAILSWHFDIRPKKIADTLCMARAIHTIEVGGSLSALVKHYNLGVKGTEVLDALGKRRLDFTPEEMEAYAGYCINDVELTYALFKVFIKGFPRLELDLIDLTLRMFTEPVLEVDRDLLTGHLTKIRATKEKLLTKAKVDRKQIMSNPQFAELLTRCGVQPPKKVSLTTGKETYAFAKTDEGFKALQEHSNPLVQVLVATRMGVKSTIDETRTERLIAIGERGKLPIPLKYYAAHTGRWGGDDKVNMQNLPRGSILKKAICAPEGYQFVDCDLSQIEARTLAWLAEQDDLVEAFDRGDDVYKIMASAIYNKPKEEITKDERFVGKTTILGAGYGMGANKFKAQLATFGVDLSQEECDRIIRVYRETYPNIPKLWRAAGNALEGLMQGRAQDIGKEGILVVDAETGIKLPNGLHIKYPNLRKEVNEEDGRKELVYDTKRGRATIPNRIYGGKVIENVCQALARIVIGEQLLRVSKRYKVVMTVHDAIGCIAPLAEIERAMEYVEYCMRIRPEWAPDLPLDCEGGYANSYGEC
jgi:DNA polymerase I-like protein with 3'-5' exonuclease and polymerase domains